MTFGIKRILFSTTFLAVVLPMLLVAVVSLYLLTAHLRTGMERESILFSRSIAAQISAYFLREPIRTLSLTRDHLASQQHNDSTAEQFFSDVLRANDYVESIYLLDGGGKVRQASNRIHPSGDQDLHGLDFSSQQAFQSAVSTKLPRWSNSQSLSGGEPTIAVCLPANNGALLAHLRLGELTKIINEASANRNYTAFVVEKGGRIIAHPDSTLVAQRENVGGLPLLNDTSGEVTGGALDFKGVHYHATVVPISETEWKLVVAKPLQLAEQPIRYLERIFLLGVGIMLLLAAGGAIIANRVISRPFAKLEKQSQLVAEGRFDEVEAVPSRCSEILMLSDTISAMASEVHQRELNLHDKNDELLATEEMLRVQLEVSESNQRLLSESNLKLETMINASPLAIIGLNEEGVIGLWNEAAAKLFSCTETDLDNSLEFLFPAPVEHEAFLERLRSEHYLRLPDQHFLSHDNRQLVVSLVSAPLSVAGTFDTEFILMVEDITQRAILEEQLHQAQKMDVIGQLAGGVAHDFNNMLAGIIGSAELLKYRMAEDDSNLKMVTTILNAASRSADLTRDLLAFSRKAVKELKPVAVNETINAVIGLLERTIDKRISLVTDLDAPDPVVLGDASLLQNSLLNLGVNSRDAMPDGGTLTFATAVVTLDASDCHSHQILLKPGKYLKISVSDTGVGIPREIVGRIFEPFFTTKSLGKGTGLGLAAVYGTVRDHNGSINVYSEPGRGTVFNVYLPLCEAASNTNAKDNIVVKGSGTILLVDDEEILRFLGSDLLEELGYTVYLAEDGEEALDMYAKHHDDIDLVILDVIMPKLDGRETYLKLKELDPTLKVLFCSGFQQEGTSCELQKLGAEGFIQKPYNMVELSGMVAKVLAC